MSYIRFGFCAANVEATLNDDCCGGLTASSPAGVLVQPEAGAKAATWYDTPKAAAPACSAALSGAASTPRPEKKFRKSITGPARLWVREPTHSTEATFLPARSAACWIVSAWRIEAPRLVRLKKLPSPVRWNVLFVDPCSPGQVPVASVYQPTPVFGGKACLRPLSPLTPAAYSAA